jgi:hypothetical protein
MVSITMQPEDQRDAGLQGWSNEIDAALVFGPLYDERLRVDRIVSRLDVTDDSAERTDLASKRSNRQSRGASGWELPIPASEPNPLVSFAVRTYMADELLHMGDGLRRPDRPRDSCPRRTTADPSVPSSTVS